MDQNLRLDRLLADLLAAIDRRVGIEKTVVALTADHGVLPLVEELQRRGVAASRVNPDEFWQRARDALKQHFPAAPDLVADASGNRLYWRLPAFRNGAVERAAAEKFLVERLRRHPLVAGVYTASELANVSDRAPEMTRLFANAYFQRRSPHLIVRFNEFVYAGNAFGTAHGTAYPHDREVPRAALRRRDTPREFRAAGGARRYRPDPGQDASPQNGAGAGHAHSLGSAAITARDKSRASVVTRPGIDAISWQLSKKSAPCCPPGK